MNRSALTSLLAVAAALALGACSPDTTGDACTSNDDCQTGQTCFTGMPGGYCSKGCTNEGSDKACGSGTVCSPSGDQLICALECEDKSDCREDYECNGITGSNLKSCRPKA